MRTVHVILAAAAVLLLSSGDAGASVFRINLNKANQTTSPMKYSVTLTRTSGLVTVDFELPAKQPLLKHLWRVDVNVRQGTKVVVGSPLELKPNAKGALAASLYLDPAVIGDIDIVIRTGEHAPLAETWYVIDIGSFK